MRCANRTPLTEGQRELAGDPENVRFALACASPWRRRFPRYADDIDSAALEGLVTAARSFDPERAAFRTLVAWHVAGRVKDFLRDFGRPKGFRRGGGEAPTLERIGRFGWLADRPRNRPGGTDREADEAFDPAAGEMPVGWALDAEAGVEELTKGLPRRHKRAVRLLYTRAGATLKGVGRLMGLSESRASQLVGDGLAMLREKFTTEKEIA